MEYLPHYLPSFRGNTAYPCIAYELTAIETEEQQGQRTSDRNIIRYSLRVILPHQKKIRPVEGTAATSYAELA